MYFKIVNLTIEALKHMLWEHAGSTNGKFRADVSHAIDALERIKKYM